jgi:RES domain-containing protein
VIVYRISHKKYKNDMWSGAGGLTRDGRWNTQGHPVVYAAQSKSLAILEKLVGIDNMEDLLDYVVADAQIADNLIVDIDEKTLPADWFNPVVERKTSLMGDQWLQTDTLAFRVPSAVVRTESDILINPRHKEFRKIDCQDAQPLDIDPRLLKVKKTEA